MPAHGGGRDSQALGDRGGGMTAAQQAEDLTLSCAEPVAAVAQILQQPPDILQRLERRDQPLNTYRIDQGCPSCR